MESTGTGDSWSGPSIRIRRCAVGKREEYKALKSKAGKSAKPGKK